MILSTPRRKFRADTDPQPAGVDGNLDVVPQAGGYTGRDPRTEMPRMPSIPEAQDDAGAHDDDAA